MTLTAAQAGLERAAVHATPERRLTAVAELGLLARVGDPVLTALTRLARAVTGAGSAGVHIFDAESQHRVAAAGAPLDTHPAADAMCRLVVEGEGRIVVPDATADRRFDYSSFTRDPDAPVRFYASLPLRSGGGVVVGTLCAFDHETRELSEDQVARLEDIAQLACAHLELMRVANELGRAATLDPLTVAVNRVIFDDRLAQALARRRRRGSSVLAAVIDLDDFKAINDRHGHGCGDAALQWVARRLHESVRGEDTIGRLGGDEFGVVAEVSAGDHGRLLQKLRSAAEGFDPPLTLSLGAVLAEDGDDVETILQRADQAMYADKVHRKRSRPDGTR
ncbi:MAG TPA: sensor domain-containing diguanylate cyclase [Solirubrobacteraceae bacterium]|nr:sensor domain-containing diguanylate cyclase [Solirubrobacteraceae bacterium]